MKQVIMARIAALETMAKSIEKENRRKTPFAEIHVLSFLQDRAEVWFYPSGAGSTKRKHPEKTIIEAIKEAESLVDRSRVSVSLWPWCKEWAHAQTILSDDYTAEQKARFKAESPELSVLYDNNGELLRLIGSLPQRMEARK